MDVSLGICALSEEVHVSANRGCREQESTAASGEAGGRPAWGGGAQGPGPPSSLSRCRAWTTLGMGKDEEEMSFVRGSHLFGRDDGEFRCWSKATLGACCYGNSSSTLRG